MAKLKRKPTVKKKALIEDEDTKFQLNLDHATIQESLTCCLCLSFFSIKGKRTPTKMGCKCEKYFCWTCISEWKDKDPSDRDHSNNCFRCPMCRDEVFWQCVHKITKKDDPMLFMLLESIVCDCKHASHGCKVRISKGMEQEHEAVCKYNVCKWPKCDWVGLRCNQKIHENSCKHGIFNCIYPPCKFTGNKKDLKTHELTCKCRDPITIINKLRKSKKVFMPQRQ